MINVEHAYVVTCLPFVIQIQINAVTTFKPENEHQKIKLKKTTIYRGRDILILTYELSLCYDGIFYLARRIYLKLVGYLVLKPKLAMRYRITVGIWQYVDRTKITYGSQAYIRTIFI